MNPIPSADKTRAELSDTLVCDALTVKVGAFTLQPITLAAHSGEILALLGPNGAGKTTLLNAILGLLPLSGGSASIAGLRSSRRDVRWLRHVGVVPDDPDELIGELTAQEYWLLIAEIRCPVRAQRPAMLARARELAARLRFAPEDRALIAGYSHGMRKKTQLVGALLHAPALLVVDEPRNGLDPVGIAALEEILAEYRAAGGTVLVATHDLHWAARVADRLAILADGKLLALGATDELSRPSEDVTSMFFRITGTDSHPAAEQGILGRTG